ncbi:MAG: cupin domain-containing protein [Microthrixaceae bacterium]
MAETVARKGDEGTAVWMLGGLYEVKVSGAETGGAVTVMQMTVPPGTGAPPHTHPGNETVVVLEGTLDYDIGGQVSSGGPGSVFNIPQGTLEHFTATGGENLKILAVYTPGGIDRFFEEAGERALSRELPPPSDTAPDFERIAAIGARYGMEIQAPPT